MAVKMQLETPDGQAAYPFTKTDCVFDNAGNRLDRRMMVYSGDPESEESGEIPEVALNADLLGGLPPEDYATKESLFNLFNENSTPTKTPFIDENGKEIYHICLNINMVANNQTIISWSPSNLSRIILMIPLFNSIDGVNYCGVDLQSNGTLSERMSSVDFRKGTGLVVHSTIDGTCKCHIWYTLG